MCHYYFWDKTGKQLGFSDLNESLWALNNTELSDVISILIDQIEVSEFDMPTANNSLVDASSLKMHVR